MQNLRKTNESGRSMVEMLGVLAIIGVLSVTGVAGYKAAVRKALANNLLNQASMRATDVATQIGSGNLEDLTNDAFDNDLGGGVTISSTVKGPDGYADYDESDEQFTLTLEGLDEEMCQQMQSMAGGSRSVVRAVLCDGDKAILTFNKDLSANPVSSDFDGDKEGCENSGRKYCDNDTCIPATEECPTGEAEVSIDTGVCENGNVYLSYMKDPCGTETPDGMECTKNSDCTGEKCSAESGKCYCNLTGDWQNSSAEITGATCETLDAGRETTYENGSDKKTFLVGPELHWWAAENWCKAHNKNLVSYSTVNSLFDCDKDTYSCTGSKFTTTSNWSKGTLSDNYWTAGSDSPYSAWFAGVYYEADHRDNGHYALCEE